MLVGLHIENVAAIESLDVEFSGGFNVLSGETGSGKSIMIDSINMVTGARASRDIIRNGASSAKVQALFQKDGDEVLLSRELFADGRSVCRINGELATSGAVRDISRKLIAIHGQHDNQLLLQSSNHLIMLDKFCKNQQLLEEYRASFSDMKNARIALDNYNQSLKDKEERLSLLSSQIEEIDGVKLEIGEDERLEAERLRLSNREKILSGVSACHDILYENGGVHDMLSSAISHLESAASYDEKLFPLLDELRSALAESDDASHELGRFASSMDFDQGYLHQIEERLDLIYTLCRKYGGNVDEIISYREKIGEEYGELSFGTSSERLETEYNNCLERAQSLADSLSQRRREGAEKLSAQIMKELSYLDMEKVSFEVSFEDCPMCENGVETAEFLISTNPGEMPKPLQKIASGGELSRIMLASETVLEDEADTLIFDEIDTGVSGRAAVKIGEKLYSISKGRQVICITHLAQLAVMADAHFLIEKSVDERSAKTRVSLISGEERYREIARITGGAEITDITLKNAEEMLLQANALKCKL